MRQFVYWQGQADMLKVTQLASGRAQPSDPLSTLFPLTTPPLCRPEPYCAASKSRTSVTLVKCCHQWTLSGGHLAIRQPDSDLRNCLS